MEEIRYNQSSNHCLQFFKTHMQYWSAALPVHSLRQHPFLLALCRWERFARNVPSGEERGETDVFAGYPHNIAHSHDINTILTSRQTREKLQCLYENLMSNNFRGTAVLKKI